MIGKFLTKEYDFEVNLKEYITSDTYVKPSNLAFLYVICIGAGGGGASGGRVASVGSSVNGGGYGGGGSISRIFLEAADISNTESIVIGAGGVGGTPSNTNSFNAGGIGGDTTFGSLCLAKGGYGGGVGANRYHYTDAIPINGLNFYISTLNSSSNTDNIPLDGISGMTDDGAGPSGGFGGRHVSSISRVGGTGGSIRLDDGSFVAGGTPGIGADAASIQSDIKGGDGIDDIYLDLLKEFGIVTTRGIGVGGGGCGATNTGSGFTPEIGGRGGRCAGGGAGSSCSGYSLSGAGGDGGDGLVLILEFLY